MTAVEIRPARAADRDAVAAGFARACGKNPEKIARNVRWVFDHNPAGSSSVVAARGSDVVAHLGASHVPMLLEGRRTTFARIYAPWVAPEYRIAGVHALFGQVSDLFDEVLDAASVDAVYGIFSDDDWWTLRRWRGFEGVRTELLLVRPPGPHRAGTARADLVRLTAESIGTLRDGVAMGPCHAIRDAVTVSFRTGGPYERDAAWIALRDGRAAGLLIVRDEGGRRLVLDFACAAGEPDAATALFDVAIGDGAREVRLPWFSRSPWFLVAQRLGFRARPEDLPLFGIRTLGAKIPATWLMQHWDASAADLGLAAPPQMLAEEEDVTTAYPGTLTARERRRNP